MLPCCHFINIQIGVVIWKCSNQSRIMDCSAFVTLKFDGWPRKKNKHLFYTTLSILHYFVAICEFKLELKSRKTKLVLKSLIFRVTLKIDGYPQKNEKKMGTSSLPCKALCRISKPSMNSNWNYSLETLNSGQNLWFFCPCDLEIWQMTLKNNRAPLLCIFKLCASFRSHLWI